MAPTTDIDVLIVGAGLSGIGAAVHLSKQTGRSFAVLDSRSSLGGTWDLFRYPGVRSDSDMFTLGYDFQPWTSSKGIADGADILDYLTRAARENGIDRHIRYNQKVLSAAFSSADATWTVRVENPTTGEKHETTCRFLFLCAGYYNYANGYTPDFPGVQDFNGQVVHPQHWPADLDVAGKRVVVIGSGATAVTLVPSLARQGADVTMLQRSPTYIVARPQVDVVASFLQRLLPSALASSVIRWKNVFLTTLLYVVSRHRPTFTKNLLRKDLQRRLPAGYDIESHFTPSYEPWDQRLCVVPDGDLFKTIRDGRATVVTDHVDTFTTDGIRLRSGGELAADLIVTATGLNLLTFGGVTLSVDGRDVVLNETVAYKGAMLSGVPNLAFTIGYTNASWTLKADLVANYVCRLLNLMTERGVDQCTPTAPPEGEPTSPFLDLTSGYVQRSINELPLQGARAPWRLHQNYVRDIGIFRRAPLDDGILVFGRTSTSDRIAA